MRHLSCETFFSKFPFYVLSYLSPALFCIESGIEAPHPFFERGMYLMIKPLFVPDHPEFGNHVPEGCISALNFCYSFQYRINLTPAVGCYVFVLKQSFYDHFIKERPVNLIKFILIADEAPERIFRKIHIFHKGYLAEQCMDIIVPVKVCKYSAELFKDAEIICLASNLIAGPAYIKKHLFKAHVALGICLMFCVYQPHNIFIYYVFFERGVLKEQSFKYRPCFLQIIRLFHVLQLFASEQKFVERIKKHARYIIPDTERPQPSQPRNLRLLETFFGDAAQENVPVFVNNAPVFRMLVHYVNLHPLLLIAVYPVSCNYVFKIKFFLRSQCSFTGVEIFKCLVEFLIFLVDYLKYE